VDAAQWLMEVEFIIGSQQESLNCVYLSLAIRRNF
jgi:hypothetical protein